MEHPKTLTAAIRYYSDPANCVAVVKAMRWDGGEPPCPYCGERKHYWLANQMRWKCASCRKQFSVKVGTIFEDSPLSLDKWLIATWMVANCRNGVSSYEIMRTIGVTQKSAWFMLHRIRLAMQDTSGGMLSGEVEVDESFIGGKARNMHLKKRQAAMKYRNKGKTVVMGMMERGGKVRATVIADRQKPILHEQIERNVEAGSNVFTDELVSYWGLNEKYVHQVINHAMKYVEGNVHTNSLENFWALLKRGLNGTYVSVEPFHLFRYIDEQAFRFNNRRLTDWGRFSELLKQISNKRLTYAEVTGRGLETASF
jgi:transposase-like protein